MNADQPLSHALAPCKTLWFEFLITPELLKKHLNEQNPDPNPIELIINFLNNISLNNNLSSTTNDENFNSNNTVCNLNVNNNEGSNSNSSSGDIVTNVNSKKFLGIRLLALKVAAFLKFDLDILEQNLPITMQYTLLNELIKICDNNAGNNCSLFAYINYYRWILRSVIKLSYPSRKTYSIPIPLLQQIDPCYLPHETIEIWFKKLRDLSTTAVNGLEKVIKENDLKEITNIIMPNFDCIKPLEEDTSEMSFDWQQVTKLNTNEIMDTIKFELGKWFFFNESYMKANSYFNKIIVNEKNIFSHLEQLKYSANQMINNECDLEEIEKVEELKDINFYDCFDLSELEKTKDYSNFLKKLKDKLDENLNDKQVLDNLKTLCFYFKLKLPHLSKELIELSGEIENKDEKMDFDLENKKEKCENDFKNDLEFKLIESTDPETILSLVSKTNKSPQEINKLWELPKIHLICLKNVKNLSIQQQNKCFFILAKAFELRNAKFYYESRILFSSLLNDIQSNMIHMAELISYEILLTDLEYQFAFKDIDERKISELSKQCEDVLIKKETISDILPNLLQHCCIFLLENDIPLLKDHYKSSNSIIKLSSTLYCIKNLNKNSNINYVTELWETILLVFFDSKNASSLTFSKRRKIQNQKSNSLTIDSLISFVNSINQIQYVNILVSCLAKMHNLIKDNQGVELTTFSSFQINWPNSIGTNSNIIDLSKISFILKILIEKALKKTPNDISYIKCKAELALVENQYHESLKNFVKILIITTDYFKTFKLNENESIIQKMITCSVKLGCFTQAVVLHQMTKEINYQLVFKALGEKICYDSCDDLYDCIWDLTILEFLVNMHYRKGELDRKTKVVRIIGQLELNSNNVEEIRAEAANIRRGKFFRYMAKKYL